ncbi:MAG: penicillin-binding protein 2 [Endomicrobium sp.]|jgi:cell division protein FtsI (penicillin-binding protein 3)|nr:penicillin-binding protein 2 [Endomicrobium sp.]
MNVKNINRKFILVAIVSLLFFLLFSKLIYVQICLHKKINNIVKKMVMCRNVEMSKRGDILDSKGKILASSIKKYTIFLDTKIIDDFYKVKNILFSNGIAIKVNNLNKLKKTSYYPIAFDVNVDTVDKIRSKRLRGVGFESKYKRFYPEGRFLAHILGITGFDGNGLEGIEKIYNEVLSGHPIVTKVRRDGYGRIIHDKFVNEMITCGQNVELSIDSNIQFIAEQELREAFDKYKAKKAICIIQNPKTGAILAMVSLPDFDSSNYKIKDIKTLRNSAITDIYEPGSTFKIVAIAAALEQNKISPTDNFYLENGKYRIARHTIKDNHKIDGYVSLKKIMEQSSNIGIVKITQKLGAENFYDYIKKFGFYSLTGIDLPGESKGILVDIDKWNALSLPTISFGQGIGVTAIQVINAFSAIANDGVLMKPSVIHSIADSTEIKTIFKPREIRRVISVKTAKTIKELLMSVVEFGTGKSAKIVNYTVGGKTGTAQKVDPLTKRYSTKNYVVSFCGMIPAINPEIVILVIIDEPKHSNYYASSVASPIFAKIAEKTVLYLNIKKDDMK